MQIYEERDEIFQEEDFILDFARYVRREQMSMLVLPYGTIARYVDERCVNVFVFDILL